MKIGYNKSINVPNLDTVYIRGNSAHEWRAFHGLGKDGLLTINTKTYLDEPIRSSDGSMTNINDATTFIVPQTEFNFKYFDLDEYVALCDILEDHNEFEVKYFDVRYKQWVTHKMYCKPQELTKIYNIRTSVIGVFDYKVQFVGTLNSIPTTQQISFRANRGGTFANGNTAQGGTFAYKSNVVFPSRHDLIGTNTNILVGWNTKSDGSGINYLPGTQLKLVSDLLLYAQWHALAADDYEPFMVKTADGTDYEQFMVKTADGTDYEQFMVIKEDIVKGT